MPAGISPESSLKSCLADLPVPQSTKFLLVINLQTVRALDV
jgi:hypothetical protein